MPRRGGGILGLTAPLDKCTEYLIGAQVLQWRLCRYTLGS
jgi:hypothetical protein